MENKIKGWANYGVLAHEKQTLFSFSHPMDATLSEKVEVEIPEGWGVSKNQFEEYLLESPEGETYTADEIIQSWGDNPALMWYDGTQKHRVTLQWKEI